jgi:Ca2+-binding RTX toxin-like protein
MNKSIAGRFLVRWFFALAIIQACAQMSNAQEAILFRRERILRVTGTEGAESMAVVVTGTSFSVKKGRTGITPREIVSIRDSVTGERFSTLAVSSVQRIEVDAGGGGDMIDMRQSPVRVTVNGGTGEDIIYGSEFNDILYSESGTAFWYGTDSGAIGWIFGFGGNDIIGGGNGNDWLSGGEGDDTLFGIGGDDAIYGGNGNDGLFGGQGADDLYGGAGLNEFYFDFDDYIDSDTIGDDFIYTP